MKTERERERERKERGVCIQVILFLCTVSDPIFMTISALIRYRISMTQ
jgi:hypothetical protein